MLGRAADGQKFSKRRFVLHRSNEHDPACNLSVEEHLFSVYDPENRGGEELMLFYVNSPAVVIGKHQNPWRECDVPHLGAMNIPLLRRISGGGTVYHDCGNLNWSFMGPKEGFSQEENLQLICRLASAYSGIELSEFSLSPRGDVLLRGKKLSGNALTFKGNKALHHGTLLIDSDLAALRRCFSGPGTLNGFRMETAAVASVPSPVGLLADEAPRKDLSASGLMEVLSAVLETVLGSRLAIGAGLHCAELPPDLVERQRSVEWVLKRTPDFCIILNEKTRFAVRHGVALREESGQQWDLSDPSGLESFLQLLIENGSPAPMEMK